MKNPAPTRAKTISTVQKRMTLTWILAGMTLSKSGKTENKTNTTLLYTLGKVVSDVRPRFLLVCDNCFNLALLNVTR